MSPELLESLAPVAHDVLRAAAFALPEPAAKDDLAPPASRVLLAAIRFRGPASGEIRLALGWDVCETLAADILSLEDETPTHVQVEDVVKELLNIICGNWLTAVYGEAPVFALSVPNIRSADEDEWLALRDRQGSVGLTIDDCPVLIELTALDACLDEPAPCEM